MLEKSFVKVRQGDIDVYYVSIKLKDINEGILDKRNDDYEGLASEKAINEPIQKSYSITKPLIINSLENDAIEIKDNSVIIDTKSSFELIYGYDEIYKLLKNKRYDYSETGVSCEYSFYQEDVLVAFVNNLDFEKKKEIFEISNLDTNPPSYLINKRKKHLNLLSQEETSMLKLLERLDEEYDSPLNSKISLYEKVVKGIDSSVLAEAIKSSGILSYTDKESIRYKMIKIVCNAFVNANITNESDRESFYAKTTNVVYVLNLMPYIWDICVINRVFFTDMNIQDILKSLQECEDFKNSLINIKSDSMAKSLAKKHGNELKSKLTCFDVASGI